MSTFGSFVAGGCAGIAESVAVVTPQETIKTKLIDAKMGLVDGVKMASRPPARRRRRASRVAARSARSSRTPDAPRAEPTPVTDARKIRRIMH